VGAVARSRVSDRSGNIVKHLKEQKLKKVQAAIQGDQVRVSSPRKTTSRRRRPSREGLRHRAAVRQLSELAVSRFTTACYSRAPRTRDVVVLSAGDERVDVGEDGLVRGAGRAVFDDDAEQARQFAPRSGVQRLGRPVSAHATSRPWA
jgi:hypothetical protein